MISVPVLPHTRLSVVCASRAPKKQWQHGQKNHKPAGGKPAQKRKVSAIKDEDPKNDAEMPHTAALESAAMPTTAPAPAAASERAMAALDDDTVPLLDDEDSSVLLDALSAVRKQEERLAAETQTAHPVSVPGEHASPQVRPKKRRKAVTGIQGEADAQKNDDGSSRKDRMRNKASLHVSKASEADLFGTSAGSFEALGLQKARF